MNVIETENLVKKFSDTVALNGVNLSVGCGELFGLLGVNGAGKTTLIRILCGLLKPTEGNAFVLGKNVNTDMAEIKKHIAVSPQETSVAPNLTVRENFTFFAQIYGYSAKEAKTKADALIERFSMEKVADRRAVKLSGGWQRRLSVAATLVSDPEIIFLDEPTLGLDVLARRELWHIIQSLKGTVTIILTSHYLEEIEHLCDRVTIMSGGNVLTEGTVGEIIRQTGAVSFEDAFVGIIERSSVK